MKTDEIVLMNDFIIDFIIFSFIIQLRHKYDFIS